MFPHSYTYNPGVVLDPITMTPMITHGGNITVNPLGVPMRPEQKVWQKMFVKNIPQECSNDVMIKVLNEFGAIKNFKRAADNRGRLLPFCHFELETGEQIMRIQRLFNGIKILDSNLQIKISPETDNFVKEWTTMQKDEWRKKLLAPGMNEAKQYESIQQFHIRDDAKYRKKIEETLKQINMEVKKVAIEKMREQERKEHPKEKEREKTKKKCQQQLERNFQQKEEHWLKRQREKQRELRKEKERERERDKAKIRRLEKEMNLDQEEIERKISKYLTEERKRQIEKEEEQDLEVMLQENPPLPEEQIAADEAAKQKRVKAIIEEEIKLGTEIVEEVIVEAPKYVHEEQVQKSKQLQKNALFDGYEQIQEQKEDKPVLQLNIPKIQNEEVDKQEEERRAKRIKELQEQIPRNKQQLWEFAINWDKLSKSVVLQRYIRPWLQQMSNEYMGGVEEKFIALVQKKLLSRSHPDKIIKILKQLLDDDSQEFVIRLWKKLVLEYLKLEDGLV